MESVSAPKRLARIAGLLYLIVAIFGGFAFGYVIAKVYAPGEAAKTAANVLANAGLVRTGVVADLFQATVFVFVALTLYLLLKHVNLNAARAMVVPALARLGILRLLAGSGQLTNITPPSEKASYARYVLPGNMQAFTDEGRGMPQSGAQAKAV